MMKKARYTKSRLREKMLLGVAMIIWFLSGDVVVCIFVCMAEDAATVVSANKVVVVVLGMDIP